MLGILSKSVDVSISDIYRKLSIIAKKYLYVHDIYKLAQISKICCLNF